MRRLQNISAISRVPYDESFQIVGKKDSRDNKISWLAEAIIATSFVFLGLLANRILSHNKCIKLYDSSVCIGIPIKKTILAVSLGSWAIFRIGAQSIYNFINSPLDLVLIISRKDLNHILQNPTTSKISRLLANTTSDINWYGRRVILVPNSKIRSKIEVSFEKVISAASKALKRDLSFKEGREIEEKLIKLYVETDKIIKTKNVITRVLAHIIDFFVLINPFSYTKEFIKSGFVHPVEKRIFNEEISNVIKNIEKTTRILKKTVDSIRKSS